MNEILNRLQKKIQTPSKLVSFLVLTTVILLFVIYKFYFIGLMWEGRHAPPEPDDSYAYLSTIKRFAQFGLDRAVPAVSYEWHLRNYWYVPWAAALALPHRYLDLPLERLYRLNFYLGTVLLALVLAYLFLKLGGLGYAVFGLFTLMWYAGAGGWQGFFWVGPSFYLFTLTMIVWILVVKGGPKSVYLLIPLGPVLLILHPMGPIAFLALIIYFGLDWLFSRRLDRSMGRRLAVLIGSTLVLGGLALALAGGGDLARMLASPKELLRVPDELSREIIGSLTGSQPRLEAGQSLGSDHESWLKGLIKINREQWRLLVSSYFLYSFKGKSFIAIPFVFGFVALMLQRRKALILWWLAWLLITLAMLKTNHTLRLLLFLWPVTFMISAWGFYVGARLLLGALGLGSNRNKPGFTIPVGWRSIARIRWLGVGLFAVGALSWLLGAGLLVNRFHATGVMVATQHQARKNLIWDRLCARYLLDRTTPNSIIVYASKLSVYSFLSYGLWDRQARMLTKFRPSSLSGVDGVFLVTVKGSRQSGFVERFDRRLSRIGRTRLVLEQDCGAFVIHRAEVEAGG